MKDPFAKNDYELNWSKQDIEQRFGFKGGRYTAVNSVFSFLIAVILTVGFFSLVTFGLRSLPQARFFCDMFLERGIMPYFIMFFFFWAMGILYVKWVKLGFQRQTLRIKPVPVDPDFVLNRVTAQQVLLALREKVDDTHNFILLNRVDRALSNLQNIGRIGDVSDILRTQAEYDENQMSSSYSLVGGFLWATPVFGFVGTVLGLSEAVGAFGSTLRSASDMAALKDSLQNVTAGLSVAFETTLAALVCALIIQLLLSALQGREAQFLDECNDYCHANIVSKLKLTEE